ncbi:MAG: AsmA family protein, partial [Rhodospirillaceae bacterium]|nr:AsmA family protein [Rhodospirillaceae bacterium]
GEGNWVFAPGTPPPAVADAAADKEKSTTTLPVINEAVIEDAVLTYRDGVTGKETKVVLSTVSLDAKGLSAPLSLKGKGSLNGEAFTLALNAGSLQDLTTANKPFPIKAALTAGGAEINIDGTIADAMKGTGLNATVSAKGKSLADLDKLAGAKLPPLGPYSLSAQLSEAKGTYKAANLAFNLGNSNLAGEATVKTGKALAVAANLTSTLIDLKDFIKGGEAGKSAPAAGYRKKVFPSDPLPLKALRGTNAKVSLKAAKILAADGKIPLTNFDLNLSLNKGVLTIKPLKTGLAGGNIDANLTLNASKAKASLALNLNLKQLDMATLLKEMEASDAVTGKLNSTISVKGQGTSVAAIMASLQGKSQVIVGKGTIKNSYFKLLSADILKAITPWASKQDNNGLNCVVSRFDINGGNAVSKTLLLDTTNVVITGKGSINLGSEKINMTVTPKTSDVSLMKLVVPISIGGTLANPTALPDMGALAKNAAGDIIGGVSGAVTNPVGAISGLLGGGGGGSASKSNLCAEAISGKAPAKAATPSSTGTTTGTTTAPTQPKEEMGTLEGVGKTLEGFGEGLKGLFN